MEGAQVGEGAASSHRGRFIADFEGPGSPFAWDSRRGRTKYPI